MIKVFAVLAFLTAFHVQAWAGASNSIYQLQSSWYDASGKKVSLSDLRGKVRLASMIYTSCKFSCPLAVETIHKLLGKLSAEEQAKVGVVLFSIDSDNETSESLQAFYKTKKIDPAQWVLLRSNETSVRDLSVVLGVGYKKVGSKDFSHSNVLVLLNKEGDVLHSGSSLGGMDSSFVPQLKEALKR